ncbi:hypothetical protein T266_21375 [Pseudomonas aeruginosa VRFPA05]|nr:hypothetical protein T266_21375 [Pseudomonas aeruginosa VRFPA05]
MNAVRQIVANFPIKSANHLHTVRFAQFLPEGLIYLCYQEVLVRRPVPGQIDGERCRALDAVDVVPALDQLGRAIYGQRGAVDVLQHAWLESLRCQVVIYLLFDTEPSLARYPEAVNPRNAFAIIHRIVEILGVFVQDARVFRAEREAAGIVVHAFLQA